MMELIAAFFHHYFLPALDPIKLRYSLILEFAQGLPPQPLAAGKMGARLE